MLRLGQIVGSATDPLISARLHDLEHRGRVERILLGPDDARRHRLYTKTDSGTDCAISLPRSARLSNGAVLLLDPDRAVVVQLREEQWLTLSARDSAAALELGYFAGNMHWSVRFAGDSLSVLLQGPRQDYLDRLCALLIDGRVVEGRDDDECNLSGGAAARR
jgi:urease accessory protein